MERTGYTKSEKAGPGSETLLVTLQRGFQMFTQNVTGHAGSQWNANEIILLIQYLPRLSCMERWLLLMLRASKTLKRICM